MAGLGGEAEASLRGALGRAIQTPDDPLVGLNTAFFRDGAWIQAAAGVKAATPIQLVFLSVPQAGGAVSFPRVLIDAAAGSELTVVETHVGLPGKPSLSVPVVEIHAAEQARVEHLRYQDEPLNAFHLASVHGRLERTSHSILHSFALGAALSRCNLRVRLEGEGLETVLNGLYVTRDEQVADHHMVVDHASPNCASHEYFNGILNHRSRGVFHGRILVRQLAQKTDAKQTNKNLLLSDDAVANTKPQLEIYADDVKCTHGATIGQMNPASVFYLRSRGIGLENARRILMHAFAGEIIDRIRHEELRSELDRLVWERLESNAQAHV
jgi:Fe-S cluster assembly protein SufD